MISVTGADFATICRSAEAAYPEECCGLLVGRVDAEGAVAVTRVAASANLAADRRHRFEVDPALYLAFALEQGAAAAAERLVGLYHSHPDGPARPSPEDAAAAWEAGWIWLIVPVRAGRAERPAAFRLLAEGGPFVPVELRVAPRAG